MLIIWDLGRLYLLSSRVLCNHPSYKAVLPSALRQGLWVPYSERQQSGSPPPPSPPSALSFLSAPPHPSIKITFRSTCSLWVIVAASVLPQLIHQLKCSLLPSSDSDEELKLFYVHVSWCSFLSLTVGGPTAPALLKQKVITFYSFTNMPWGSP